MSSNGSLLLVQIHDPDNLRLKVHLRATSCFFFRQPIDDLEQKAQEDCKFYMVLLQVKREAVVVSNTNIFQFTCISSGLSVLNYLFLESKSSGMEEYKEIECHDIQLKTLMESQFGVDKGAIRRKHISFKNNPN